MSSILLSGPAVEPVMLEEAKAFLRVEHDDDDDVIAALIAGARVHVEAQTRRALITQSWRLIRDAWPDNGRIAIMPVPFRELTAVRVYRLDGTAQEFDEAAFVAEVAAAPAVLIGKAQVAEVGATQRAEIASDDLLQKWWRPLFALELSLLECPAFAFTLLHALWTGHDAGINGFASLSALLMTYFGGRLGVLGVYMSGRTKEKQASATGELPSTLIGELLKAVGKNKKK